MRPSRWAAMAATNCSAAIRIIAGFKAPSGCADFAQTGARWLGRCRSRDAFGHERAQSSHRYERRFGAAHRAHQFVISMRRRDGDCWLSLLQSMAGLAPETYKSQLAQNWPTALQQATAVDFMTYLVDDILVKVDRASMLTLARSACALARSSSH